MEMLEMYDRDRERAVAAFGRGLHIDSVYDDLTREGKRWIAADGKAHEERRKLVVATFVLEVVERLAPGESGGTINRLIVWARQFLIDQKVPSRLEITWHLALIGLLEYHPVGGDALGVEMEYVRDRYPADPAFNLPWGFLAVQNDLPRGIANLDLVDMKSRDHPWDTWNADYLTRAETYYQKALADPATSAEARVRIAEFRLRRGSPDGALDVLKPADGESHDPAIRYLSALLQGWAFEAKTDDENATRSFRKALAFIPNAYAAAVGLAAELTVAGSRDEAGDVMQEALLHPVADPWLSHLYPDYRRYPDLMAKLRTELK